jgi:DHA2 family multidrug resistance protein
MSSAALTIDQDVWRPKYNPWLIAVVVALAAFMEVLDTSIANVALPYMAGDLAASNEQSTWVLTSYLVSNAIILPISGWLAGAVGRKRFFLACLTVFTISLCFAGWRRVSRFFFSSGSCKAQAEAGCSRWLRPYWQTPFRRNSEA